MELIFSIDEIASAAKKIIAFVGDHKIVAFHGNLGAGKTTLIKALCKELGVKENITSPTYSIIQQYKTQSGEIIYHIDLYRLKDEEEAVQAGIEECLYSGNKCFAEWPEKAFSIFPAGTVEVFLETFENTTRKMTVKLP